MVNNSTNINKMNNGLSPKESLNSDGQQFHQYQQNWKQINGRSSFQEGRVEDTII
jgi:hypothetical protein